jgi:hypothetical protein
MEGRMGRVAYNLLLPPAALSMHGGINIGTLSW